MNSTTDHLSRRSHLGPGAALAVVLAALLAAGLTGCTSDEPNIVGTGLVTDRIDTVLTPLGVDQIARYSALKVINEDIPLHEQELVYLGERDGTKSSILANFDFSFSSATVPRDTVAFPDSLFTLDNIKTVKFSLIKPTFYQAFQEDSDGTPDRNEPTGQPLNLFYLLRQLAAPFEPDDYTGWGENVVPAVLPTLLNSDFADTNTSDEPFLRVVPEYFVRFFEDGVPVGIIVDLDAISDRGLIGFGSRDTKKFSQFSSLQVGTVVAPNFVIEFNDWVDDNQFYLMEPYADTGTFDQVSAVPAVPDDGFLLRTGLRSYPALHFDLSGLPEHAFINRALLSVTNDTTVSHGPLSSISVLEWDLERFGDPFADLSLDVLNDRNEYYSFHVTGQNSLDPTYNEVIQFDVTQAILRVVNNVYAGTRGFILTGGESFLPEGRSTAVTPDFYYREFRFMGTNAADPDHRPQLRITYSIVNDLEKGGQ